MTYEPSAELADLLGALLDDEITVEESDRLAEILAVDQSARACYRELVETHALMLWQRRSVGRLTDGLVGLEPGDCPNFCAPTGHRREAVVGGGPKMGLSPLPAGGLPVIHSLGDAFSGMSSPMWQGWPVAYLVATVIFGLGILVGSLVHVSQPDQIARQNLPSGHRPEGLVGGRGAGGEGGQSASVAPLVVGQITGMVDCQFAEGSGFGGQGSEISKSANLQNSKSLVSLGDRFALAAGLMEITYDTGAKVVLQGPVNYMVEARNGGYMSVGRLTGEVATAAARGFSAHPAAIVTDQGTEFGVEVLGSGETATHVFRGDVEVQPVGDGSGPGGAAIRLARNESVRVEKQLGGETIAVHRGVADPQAFVRAGELPRVARKEPGTPLHRWQAYSQQLRRDPALVAYYTFESSGGHTSRLPNLSAAGNVLDGRVEGAEWVYGRLPGKFALYFRGCPGDMVVLPQQKRFQFAGAFSVAVWFKWGWSKAGGYQALIGKADTAWLLERDGSQSTLVFDTRYEPSPGAAAPTAHLTPGRTDITDGRWHLAVGVYEPVGKLAKKQLYVDGRLDGENTTALPLYPNDNPVWIGANSQVVDRAFYGFIDEIAVLGRALSAGEVAEMFEAGRPADSPEAQSRVHPGTAKQNK